MTSGCSQGSHYRGWADQLIGGHGFGSKLAANTNPAQSTLNASCQKWQLAGGRLCSNTGANPLTLQAVPPETRLATQPAAVANSIITEMK